MDSLNNKLLFINELKNGKNLLAFSHGTDSTALFWILKNMGVEFDMAMVDYGIRKQSKIEVNKAKTLAQKYNKTLYLKTIQSPILSDFENQARAFRYDFFEDIIYKENYTNLILAHQLNDVFEWFLMRLSAGAGLSNALLKPNTTMKKTSFTYKILRPLYMIDKNTILSYLKENNIEYFLDESNSDKKYFRNKIRIDFANAFLNEFASGVAKSMGYLLQDEKKLNSSYKIHQNTYISSTTDGLDKSIKVLGYVSSKAQKDEILKQLSADGASMVLGGKIAICKYQQKYIAFINQEKIKKFSKDFKQLCAKEKIPYILRVFLWENSIDVNLFLSYFKENK